MLRASKMKTRVRFIQLLYQLFSIHRNRVRKSCAATLGDSEVLRADAAVVVRLDACNFRGHKRTTQKRLP